MKTSIAVLVSCSGKITAVIPPKENAYAPETRQYEQHIINKHA